MAVYKYDDLIAHKGHKIVCVTYGEEKNPVNVAIECETCNEVIMDFDKEE